jgi:hypothetical protein
MAAQNCPGKNKCGKGGEELVPRVHTHITELDCWHDCFYAFR